MRYIVQTARMVNEVANEGTERECNRYVQTDKATIPCRSAEEARDMATALQMFRHDRKAWAGLELYTEGGVKVLLSFEDVAEVARAARKLHVPVAVAAE